jgi:hypothetical protein
MRHLIATFVLFATVLAPSFGASPALEWTYQYALANTDRGLDLRYILVDIEGDATLRKTPMLDLLAEVALVNASNLPFSQADLVRITKIIVRSDDARYALVMNRLAALTLGQGPYMRDQAEYREAVHALSEKLAQRHANTQAAQYQPGSIDLGAMRDRYLAAALAGEHTTEQARALVALPTNARLDEVFAIAGAPELVVIGRGRMNYRGYGFQLRNVDQMFLYYRGLGRVTLFYDRGVRWQVAEVVADPLQFEPLMPYRADPARYGQPDEFALHMHELLSGSTVNIRRAIDAMRAQPDAPAEFNETAAELLLRGFERDTSPAAMSQWIAICGALAREPERYADVLSAVAARTMDPELRSVSANVHAYETPAAGSRYVPGSLSLETQVRKYPPLYPRSTLIGGRVTEQ